MDWDFYSLSENFPRSHESYALLVRNAAADPVHKTFHLDYKDIHHPNYASMMYE